MSTKNLARRRNVKAQTETPRRAVLYLRQSDESRGEETISDEIQERICRKWCADNNCVVVKVLWEQKSGRIWFKRKKVQLAMHMIRDNEADVVVLWRWNRLSRMQKHWAIADQLFEDLGGQVVSATEPADLTTAQGRFSKGLYVLLGELESDLIGDSWRSTHDVRRDKGLPSGGGKRFGYTRVLKKGEPERYVIDESVREIVEWMYDEWLIGGPNEKGRSPRDIVAELTSKGIVNAQGNPWKSTTLQAYLDSGFAAGLLARTTEMRDGRSIYKPFREREWIDGAHEAILSEDQWEVYKAARLARYGEPPKLPKVKHEFSGLMQCGDCDGGMTRSKRKGRNGTYSPVFVCTNYREDPSVKCVTVMYSRVLNAVKAWLAEFAEELEDESKLVQLAERKRIKARSNVAELTRELAKLDNQLAELTRQKLSKEIPDVAYNATIGPLTADRQRTVDQLAAARLDTVQPVRGNLRSAALHLLEDWDIMPTDARRNILASLIERIVIYPPIVRAGAGQGARIRIKPVVAR